MNINQKPTVFIVGGLLFGDEGKGTTVEYLTHKYQASLVIRYNGGPQAMHHVVFQDNSFHCFSQFGSGSFYPGCNTLLSKYMVISPLGLLREMEFLRNHGVSDIDKRIFIDQECIIVTPLHKLINRILETLRGKEKYGTTGMGVGITIDDMYNTQGEKYPKGELFHLKEKKSITCLKIQDLCDEKSLLQKLQTIMKEKIQIIGEIFQNFKKDPTIVYENNYLQEKMKNFDSSSILEKAYKLFYDFIKENTIQTLYDFYWSFSQKFSQNFVDSSTLISESISNGHNIIMEGAQGALLDTIYGFYPHITKSLCSPENAFELLKNIDGSKFQVIKIGVLRVYSSRHGNGPFLTHNTEWSKIIPEDHNQSSGWQGEFRIGPFDIVAARYGVEIFQPDYISLTCLDKLLVASIKHKEIDLFQINIGYSLNKKNLIDFEHLFDWNSENFVERIKKRKEEETWKNMDLVKALRNMKGVLRNLDEIKVDNLDEKMKSHFEEECQKKFKNLDLELKNKMGRYLAVIQKMLGIPIKILSFGATCSDKLLLVHH